MPCPAVRVKCEPSTEAVAPVDCSRPPCPPPSPLPPPPPVVTLKVPTVPYHGATSLGAAAPPPPPPPAVTLSGIVCPECGKQLQYRSSYRRHMRLHQGVYTHMCAVCARKFTRKEHFLRHKCNRRSNLPHRSPGGTAIATERVLNIAYPPAAQAPPLSAGADLSSDSSLDLSGCLAGRDVPVGVTAEQTAPFLPASDAGAGDGGGYGYVRVKEEVVNGLSGGVVVKQEGESRRKRTTPRKVVPDLSPGGGGVGGMDDDEDDFYMPPPPLLDGNGTVSNENESWNVNGAMAAAGVGFGEVNGSGYVNDGQPDGLPSSPAGWLAPGGHPDTPPPSKLSLATGDYTVSTSPAATDSQTTELSAFIKVVKQGNYLKLKKEAQMIEGRVCFVCPHCGKVFHRSSNFSRHMRIHRGVYSYICPTCRRGFFRKEHFLKHKCHRRGMSHIWRRKTKLDMLAPADPPPPAGGGPQVAPLPPPPVLRNERDSLPLAPLPHMPVLHASGTAAAGV